MKNLFLSLLAIVAICLISCEKEGPTGPAGKDGSGLKGDIVGSVSLNDEYGTPIADKSGVLVTIDSIGTPNTATTDANGKFTFKDIPAGTYDLIFSKVGYGTMKYISMQMVGGNKPFVVYPSELNQVSTTTIKDASIEVVNNYLNCTIVVNTISDTSKYDKLNFYYFLSTKSNVSSTNYEVNGTISSSGYESNKNIIEGNLYNIKDKFKVGTTVYVIIYACARNSWGYYDYITDQYVNPCLNPNPSKILSFKVPSLLY